MSRWIRSNKTFSAVVCSLQHTRNLNTKFVAHFFLSLILDEFAIQCTHYCIHNYEYGEKRVHRTKYGFVHIINMNLILNKKNNRIKRKTNIMSIWWLWDVNAIYSMNKKKNKWKKRERHQSDDVNPMSMAMANWARR